MTTIIATSQTNVQPATTKQQTTTSAQDFMQLVAGTSAPAPAASPAATPAENASALPAPAVPPTDIFGRKWGSGAISIDEILQYGQKQADKAQSAMDTLFAKYNIAKHPPVQFTYEKDGSLTIGAHPDKAKIEQAFEENPDVKDAMGQAFGMQSFGAELQQYAVYMEHYDAAYKSGGTKALNALTDRYLSLPKAQFSYLYGLSGLTLQANGGSIADWLKATDKALS